ncbi:hypothetical protein Droror1_Dr00024422 [Drosera rotundifolia]
MQHGVLQEGRCELCGLPSEDRDHLFFLCYYSQAILQAVLVKLGLNQKPLGWEQWRDQMLKISRGKSPTAKTRRRANGLLVYMLWKERNKRIFDKETSTHEQLCMMFFGNM